MRGIEKQREKFNMSKVHVYRHQYGVGQGCFHAQELTFGEADQRQHIYRFVYDCGSSTSADSLKWSIDHFEKGTNDKVVHAAYLSHFENDHINGLESLCNKLDVHRIYAPHIDPGKVLHIIAQQLSGGAAWSTQYERFVANVLTVASGGPLFGVPVTLVTGGPQPQVDEAPRSNTDIGPGTYMVNLPTGSTVSHSTRVTVSISTGAGKAAVPKIIWEIVPWYYGADDHLTLLIVFFMATLTGYDTLLAPGLEQNATPQQVKAAIVWMKANRAGIADVYDFAMDEFNAYRSILGLLAFPPNHNVASLCIYSGPTQKTAAPSSYQTFPAVSHPRCLFCGPYDYCHYREHAGAWIATGDALLKVPDIWSEFEAHFSTSRLDRCSTVLIPHHGADAGSSDNYNEALIRSGQNCVISAGIRNGYRHPHRNVIQNILTKPAYLQLVTESQTMGFVEHLDFMLDI